MVHGVILKSKFNQDMFVTTALTNMYMKCGKIEQSCKLFDGMHERSTISYNSMISGHGQNGNFHKAISLFIEMKQLRKEVDLSTFVVLLSSCQGREWHVYVHAIKHCFSSNSMVQNTLLDGLLKQGSAVEARVFFNKMKVKKRYFLDYSNIRINPTWSPFRCFYIFQIHVFDAMISKHRVEPSMEHYACMVDLYGRAGMLAKAKDFIENMPFEADVSVWIVFLAACKLNGSVELAQVAKSHIMEMKDEDRPMSLIMSNMYSEAGNWDDVEKERMNMGIKEPAFSWA